MRKIFFTLLSFSFTVFSFSQGGIRTYGYSGPGWTDMGYSIVMATDGRYVISGHCAGIDPVGWSDAYIISINTNGSINWQRGVGSQSGGSKDEAYSIIRTTDGGYVVAGEAYENAVSSNSRDAYVVKLTSAGAVSWTRTIDTDDNYDYAYQVIQTADGGYALAGYAVVTTYSQVYAAKLDGSGNVSWTRHIGAGAAVSTNASEQGQGIVENADGTFIIAGYTGITAGTTAGGTDVFLIKLNSNGTVNTTGWPRTLGGGSNEYGYGFIKTSDNKYVVVGSTNSFGQGGSDVYIAKLNIDGTTNWEHTIGGSGTDEGNAVVESNDGGYVVAGYTNSFGETGGAANDIYVVKFTSSGSLSWTRVIGAGSAEYGYSIAQTSTGGFAIAGYRSDDPDSDILLVTLTSSGTISSACTNTTGGTIGNPSFTNTTRTQNNGTASNSNTELTNNNSAGGSLLAFSCGTVSTLPVDWLSFTGSIFENKTLLNWQTASEQNNDYFTIERSTDAENWNVIGTLKGAGNSSAIHNYQFMDEEIPSLHSSLSTLYYRLKQTDYDGKFEYFGPISVKLTSENQWEILFKNPATEYLEGTLIVKEDAQLSLEIMDLQGRVMQIKKLDAVKGSNLLDIDIRNLDKGLYFIRSTSRDKNIFARFVKQ